MEEFLAFQHAVLRAPQGQSFGELNWVWRQGERWAILGPDNSGKEMIAAALMGTVPVISGEMHVPERVALVSPQTQREVATQESSFYQSRWHSGIAEGQRSTSDFLSQASVEERNPYEVGLPPPNHRGFAAHRRKLIRWLRLEHLLRRKLVHLSHGELRKTLFVHALLKNPQLLILIDPFAGLDPGSRATLKRAAGQLAGNSAVLAVTSRPDELPSSTSHVLLVDRHAIVGQGPKSQVLAKWRRRFPPRRVTPPKARTRLITRLASPVLELGNVSILANSGKRILDSFNWTVRPGERWAVLGPNGSGKTTLLNLLQGDHPQFFACDIRLFGHAAATTDTLWRARCQMGWMSPELHQHYPGGWTVLEVVCSGFFNTLGLYETCSRAKRSYAAQCLAELGLRSQALRPFDELAFGQQRLALLARAMVKSPCLLLLDEPAQGLDSTQRRFLLHAVDSFIARTEAALVFVTHHPREIPRCITHQLRIRKGHALATRRLLPPATAANRRVSV